MSPTVAPVLSGWGFLVAAHPVTMGTIRYSQMHWRSHRGRFNTLALPKCQKLAVAPPLNGVHPPHEWVFVEALAET
jgi:hypothetical protein